MVYFDALCAGPRSQDDYIEIAREYQAVLVSDVPVLDAEHEDEARRFMALVDELYDRNVKLSCPPGVAPRSCIGARACVRSFERTVSRLTEMQSEEYLARAHRP